MDFEGFWCHSDEEEMVVCKEGRGCQFCPYIDGGYCTSMYVTYTIQCSNCETHLIHSEMADGMLADKLFEHQSEMANSQMGRHLRSCCGYAHIKNTVIKIM